jgi:D-glycero-D-manno-heptose 1,7-bisphosphate phosphatase
VVRLILLDRDGVINRESDAFVKSAEEFIPLPGAFDAIATLSRSGFLIAVCTNQSGVGRGLLSETDLSGIHAKLEQGIVDAGGALHGIQYCPHLPDDGCDCRKPKPGMLLTLMRELKIDPDQTVFVGDSLRDLQAGRSAGTRAVLVRTGNGSRTEAEASEAGFKEVFDDLGAFAQAEIVRLESQQGAQQ